MTPYLNHKNSNRIFTDALAAEGQIQSCFKNVDDLFMTKSEIVSSVNLYVMVSKIL